MECDNTYTFGSCNPNLSTWNSEPPHSNDLSYKRKRQENGYLGEIHGDMEHYKLPARFRACFIQLYPNKGIFQSEKWKPNGSTLYHPVSSHILVNFEKYDQISLDEGFFFIGDDLGGCSQKAQGNVIHCWRFDDKEKTLFIAMSYLFTNVYTFQEIVNRLGYI